MIFYQTPQKDGDKIRGKELEIPIFDEKKLKTPNGVDGLLKAKWPYTLNSTPYCEKP